MRTVVSPFLPYGMLHLHGTVAADIAVSGSTASLQVWCAHDRGPHCMRPCLRLSLQPSLQALLYEVDDCLCEFPILQGDRGLLPHAQLHNALLSLPQSFQLPPKLVQHVLSVQITV